MVEWDRAGRPVPPHSASDLLAAPQALGIAIACLFILLQRVVWEMGGAKTPIWLPIGRSKSGIRV